MELRWEFRNGECGKCSRTRRLECLNSKSGSWCIQKAITSAIDKMSRHLVREDLYRPMPGEELILIGNRFDLCANLHNWCLYMTNMCERVRISRTVHCGQHKIYLFILLSILCFVFDDVPINKYAQRTGRVWVCSIAFRCGSFYDINSLWRTEENGFLRKSSSRKKQGDRWSYDTYIQFMNHFAPIFAGSVGFTVAECLL